MNGESGFDDQPGDDQPGDNQPEGDPGNGTIPSEPATEALPAVTAGGQIGEMIASVEAKILDAFETKLKYDSFKEQQITRLHDELQVYKQGIAHTTLKPFIIQIVRFLDQIPRHVQSLKAKPAEMITRERLFEELQSVAEDLQMILENVGIEVFQGTEPRFDPRVQQARVTVEVDDPNRHQMVAESLLSGYKLDDKIIEKERVKVLVYRGGNADSQRPDGEPQSTAEQNTDSQSIDDQPFQEPGNE